MTSAYVVLESVSCVGSLDIAKYCTQLKRPVKGRANVMTIEKADLDATFITSMILLVGISNTTLID